MKSFIAYFDFLGFKELLLNNTQQHLERRALQILTNLEQSISLGETIETPRGNLISNLDLTRINCLNISDTVIFWSQDDSIESCLELLNVSYRFNWQQLFSLPVRGCIIHDDFQMINSKRTNPKGALYSPNLIYGKGLFHAHTKCEQLDWAGTVIDSSLHELMRRERGYQEFLKEHAIKHKVPYKGFYKKDFALRLSKGLNEESFKNIVKDLYDVFENDNKSVPPSVEVKIQNTINFLKLHVDTEESDK